MCLDDKDENKNSQVDVRSQAAGQILHGNKKFTANRYKKFKCMYVKISKNLLTIGSSPLTKKLVRQNDSGHNRR